MVLKKLPNTPNLFTQKDVRETTTTPKTPPTQYYSLTGAEFKAATETDNWAISINANLTTNAVHTYFAPVHLPQGAIITQAVVYGSVTTDTWILYTSGFTGGGVGNIATANIGTTDSTINSEVRNHVQGYYFYVANYDNAGVIYGAKIIYTIE